MSPPLSVNLHTTPRDLPPDARWLLECHDSFFVQPAWWDATIAAALPDGAKPVFVAFRDRGRLAALLPMLRQGRRWAGLTTLYTYWFGPLFASDADQSSVFAALGRLTRAGGLTQLDALDPTTFDLPAARRGLARAGVLGLPFAHFGSWEQNVEGQDWATYLAGRDGRLRETIRRRLRDFSATPDARWDIHRGSAGAEAGIAAYASVAAHSWKGAEPFPDFNATLFRATMREGSLFMASLSLGERAVAAQAWAFRAGRATVLKLVHDENSPIRSAGTVLTALVVRDLFAAGGLKLLDFGRGDDAYKQSWVADRRQRVGLLLASPWHPAGAMAIARWTAGRLRHRLSGSAFRPGVLQTPNRHGE
jgi:hypothetical protein